MRKTLLSSLLFSLATAHAALAQPGAQPSSVPPAPSLPPPPSVEDPMLTPVPPAKNVLASWEQAIAYLRARSTDLKMAVDQVLQAEAQTRGALAAYLPTINGSLSYTHNLITNPSGGPVFSGASFSTGNRVPFPDDYNGGVQLQQALVNVQAFDAIGISELGEDVAALSVEDEKRTLALGLANQIVAAVTAERAAEINRVGLRVALEQLDITKRKQTLGAANGLDVVRAQQNVANARATLVTGDESLLEAREALGLALGTPVQFGVAPEINIDGLAQSTMSSCRVVQDLDQRADVAAARMRLEVAKRNLRNVWFQFLPTVGARSTVSADSTVSAPYPNPTWNIQATLLVPIWDGGSRYSQLRSARAAEDTAAQQLEALRRQAIIQVEQARRQLEVAETSDKVAREQRDLAAKNDQMTQMAFLAGQGTSLELVTASEAHRQAELNLALQDFGVVKARVLAVLALATCPW
jgi:outer membrane protein, multidrug efflux system